jgi:hypothetical protein
LVTATYVVAAGCHTVLAVVFEERWHGVLAGMMAVVAPS